MLWSVKASKVQCIGARIVVLHFKGGSRGIYAVEGFLWDVLSKASVVWGFVDFQGSSRGVATQD